MTDEELIKKTLKLAEKGRGRVSPNPLVGAIIIKNKRIVANGFHSRFGGPHAEVVALESARGDVKGGTLYINLEPCSHHGKQPPCVDRIVNSGIKRAVIGTPDPNPLVNGKGIAFLRERGLEVRVGVLAQACRDLNAGFFHHVKTGKPYVTLKIAQTLDGRIAATDGSSKWITSEKARRLVHKMRSQNDAVLVGIGTILKDDPELTVRLIKGANPRRIVLDSKLRIPLKSNLLLAPLVEKTIVVTTSQAPEEKVRKIEDRGATVWIMQPGSMGGVDLAEVIKKLGSQGVTSVLVEGGSRVFSAFLREKLVDKIAVFIAPKILGAGLSTLNKLGIHSMDNIIEICEPEKRKVGGDLLITGTLNSKK